MSEVERRQAQRGDYLVAVYELSECNPLSWVSEQKIAEAAGIPQGQIIGLSMNAQSDRLVESKSAGGLVSITPEGVRRAEALILERENAGVPTYSSVVLLTDVQLIRALEPLLGKLRAALDSAHDMDSAVKADIGSDLESAEAQLRANEPNRGVIRASLDRIKTLGPWVAGATGLAADIIAIIHGL